MHIAYLFIMQCNSGNLSWVKLTLLFLQCNPEEPRLSQIILPVIKLGDLLYINFMINTVKLVQFCCT